MPRRVLQGRVVSAKSQNTITVLIERKVKHPIYKKTVKVTKKYHAHDPQSKCKEGDKVSVIETRPISKTKKWMVV